MGEEPQIHVRGERNRVAGRDYYESPTLVLAATPDQLRGKLDCATCGQCVLRAHDPGCSRCNSRAGAERRSYLALIMGGLIAAILAGVGMPDEFAPSALGQFLKWVALGAQIFAFAMILVALFAFLWHYRRRDC